MDTMRSIYEGRPPGRLFWTLDHLSPDRLPAPGDFSAEGKRKFFGRGASRGEQKPFASRNEPWLLLEYRDLDFSHRREGETDFFRWETPSGILTARRHSNHMIEFPLKTTADIPRWKYVQEHTACRRNPSLGAAQGRGQWRFAWKWSPVQEMLQFGTGVENFYYFLADAPDQMRALLETMHRRNLEAIEAGFAAHPEATVFRLTENTSSQIISPKIYRELTMPHVKAYVDMAHRRRMRCVVHMCGTLAALLDEFERTGMDGIHSVTPPPVGDADFAAIRRRFGRDFTILGRFSAQLFIGRKRRQILDTLSELVPASLIDTPFALQATNDEMRPTGEDVRALVDALETLNREYTGSRA